MTQRPTPREIVLSVTAEVFETEPKALSPDTRFSEDLHADSLDCTEIVVYLEHELDITFSDTEIDHLKTVGGLITRVEMKVQQRDRKGKERIR
jgi:acyl carrier protein